MVVSKDVQSAVHHQSQNLLANRDALSLRVVASDRRTNVDVSNNRTTFSGSSKAERDHIGWAMVLQVAAIQLRNRGLPDERDGQHRILYASGLECGDGRFVHSRP